MLSHFDPLATLIEEAHKYGLWVHAWFEFDFSFAYNDPRVYGFKNLQNFWVSKKR